MARRVERIDHENSFMTTFVFKDGNIASEIHVPVDQADDYEAKISAATWNVISDLYGKKGSKIIKGV